MVEGRREAGAAPGRPGTTAPARPARTSRLGLTNRYLEAGLHALIAGLVCAALLLTRSAGDAALPWLGWAATAGVLGGTVLYGTGRIIQFVDRPSRA